MLQLTTLRMSSICGKLGRVSGSIPAIDDALGVVRKYYGTQTAIVSRGEAPKDWSQHVINFVHIGASNPCICPKDKETMLTGALILKELYNI